MCKLRKAQKIIIHRVNPSKVKSYLLFFFKVLNGSAISNDERRGAELDFLKRYGSQYLSIKTKEESIQFHGLYPCYQRLVNGAFITIFTYFMCR